MLSTIIDSNCKASKTVSLKIWKGVQKTNNTISTKKSTNNAVVSMEKRKRFSAITKSDRQFFEHDTRYNTDCYSYVNSTAIQTIPKQTPSKPIIVHEMINDDDDNDESSNNTAESIKFDMNQASDVVAVHQSSCLIPMTSDSSVKSDRKMLSNEKTSFYCDSAMDNNFIQRQAQSINLKLRKKLFKTQRKLRLQAAAFRKQQLHQHQHLPMKSNCCCNCACSGEDALPNYFHHRQHKIQFNRNKNMSRYNNNMSNCGHGLSLCTGQTNNNKKIKHSIKSYGLRSVVR